MRALVRTVAWSGMALAIAGGATVVLGQSRNEPADPGSLAALTAEVRELRLAVQVSSQLDAARRGLDAAAAHAGDVTTRLTDLEGELPNASDPMQRAAIRDGIRAMQRERETATLQEQQARNREQELSQSLQVEEGRWSTLLSRLEALTQR